MRVVSYLHGAAAVRRLRRLSLRSADVPSLAGACESPLLAACECCDALRVWSCANHRESRCRPCAARYRRRVFRVADHGLARAGERFRYMLTLTAPSDRAHRRFVPGRRGDHGPCDCSAGFDLAEWNGGQGKAWNRLRTALVREYPGLVYLRSVEVQDRGALHLHVLLVGDVPVDALTVHGLALAAGFGCVLDLAPVKGSAGAARYVAKYVSKACDQRERVPWHDVRVDRATGEMTDRTDAAYRTWSASRTWGITMREVVEASRAAAERHARRQRELAEADVRLRSVLTAASSPPVDAGAG